MMDITIVCATHGRPYHVNEAVECYRKFEIPQGVDVEMLVLNDCPEQELHGNIPGVKIVNVPMIEILSDKMNAIVEMAEGDWIAPLDDDDLSLPHRIVESASFLQANPSVKAIRHTHAWVWEFGKIDKFEKNLFIGSSMLLKEYWWQMGGARSDQWWDQTIWFGMLEHGSAVEITPTREQSHFVYRWGGVGHHYSGLMKQDMSAKDLFAIYRAGIKKDKRWREGKIEIVPEWKQDYIEMVKQAIAKGV
jgi:glycosyltransferase involved in cell wall biosynthesis